MKPNSPTVSITAREAQDLIAEKLEDPSLKKILNRLVIMCTDLDDARKKKEKEIASLQKSEEKLSREVEDWKRGKNTHKMNLNVLGDAFSLFLREKDKPGVKAFKNCETRLHQELPFHRNAAKTLTRMISKLAKEARNFHPDQDEVLFDPSRLSEKEIEQVKAKMREGGRIKIPSYSVLIHPSSERKGKGDPTGETGPEEQQRDQYGGPYKDVPEKYRGNTSGGSSKPPKDNLPF